jgi:hypothetical protein
MVTANSEIPKIKRWADFIKKQLRIEIKVENKKKVFC